LLERLEYVAWTGELKDLGFVVGASPAEVLLVDDDAGWVRPDQRDRWVCVAAWDGKPDNELARVRSVLEHPDGQGVQEGVAGITGRKTRIQQPQRNWLKYEGI